MPVEDQSDSAKIYLTELDAAILADIVGHPYQLPTVDELNYTNRRTARSTLLRRLQTLIDQGVVEVVRFDGDPPKSDSPSMFFGITDFGLQVLFNRLPDATEQTLQRAYAQLSKPTSIRECERAPRPPRK